MLALTIARPLRFKGYWIVLSARLNPLALLVIVRTVCRSVMFPLDCVKPGDCGELLLTDTVTTLPLIAVIRWQPTTSAALTLMAGMVEIIR